jgi:hypothetical protein
MTIHITRRNPTVATIPTHAQTTASILTTITSHHDGWKINTLNTNTSQTQHHKVKDLYDTHDYSAKQNYPDTIPNPKGKVGIQFKGMHAIV